MSPDGERSDEDVSRIRAERVSPKPRRARIHQARTRDRAGDDRWRRIHRERRSARPGLALLAFIGRIAVREAATYFVIGTVVAVTEQEEISKIEAELDEAQHDLRDTLSEASAKAEHQEGALRPDRLVESYPIEASCLAGALGFIIGSRARPSAVGPVMIAALLGYAISRRLKE